jgi:hypothetical protein
MGETTYACPRQHLRENPYYWGKILKYYGYYKKGFFPDEGGVSSQCNKAMEIFRILDDANVQCDKVEDERRMRRDFNPSGPLRR